MIPVRRSRVQARRGDGQRYRGGRPSSSAKISRTCLMTFATSFSSVTSFTETDTSFLLSFHTTHTPTTQTQLLQNSENSRQHTKPDCEDLQAWTTKPSSSSSPIATQRKSEESQSLVLEKNNVNVCYLPYWLFLLIRKMLNILPESIRVLLTHYS